MAKKKKRKIKSSVYKAQYAEREKGSSGKKPFVDWSKLPDKPKFYKPQEGTNKINIIPFELKNKNLLSYLKINGSEVGDLVYSLDVFVHKYVGTNKEDIVCPKKNYGKPCPICDTVSELYNEKKETEAKALIAKRRTLFNVQAIVKGEAQALAVWETSQFSFTKELIEEANACLDGEDIINFADIESGSIVKFRMNLEDFGKNKMPVYKAFSFIEREEELDDDLIDEAVSFDDLLVVLKPDEIEKILYGVEEEELDDEEEEAPKSKKKKTEKVKGAEVEQLDTEEEDDDDEEEEEELDDDEDEVEEDEEEEEEEKTTSKSKKKKDSGKNKCPSGHVFGEEVDEHKECKKCPIWDECDDAS